MQLTPFTLEHALEIAEDFEDLVDTEYKVHAEEVQLFCIDYVGLAPFEAEAQSTFIREFATTKHGATALSHYDGDQFDVLVIAHNVKDENDIAVTHIRQYVEDNGVRYNFDMGEH